MVILSLLFYLVAVASCGHLLSRLFWQARITVSERIVLGAGTLALSTLVLAMPGVSSLRLISLIVVSAPVAAVIFLYIRTLRGRSYERPSRRAITAMLTLSMLAIPLILILLRVPLYLGDELVNWAVRVKEVLAHDDLPRADYPSASQFGSYPLLGTLMAVNALSLLGEMHEGAGRVITFLISSMGSLFVFETVRRRYSLATSIVAASVVHVLVFLPSLKFYTSWYPEGPTAVLILMSAYQLITAFSQRNGPTWHSVGILAISLTMLVSIRPEGLTYMPLYLLIGVILLGLQRSAIQSKLVRLAASFLPAVLMVVVWSTYLSANHLPGLRLGQIDLLHWQGLASRMNSPTTVMSAVFQGFVHTDQTVPMVSALFFAGMLGVWMFRRLDSSEKSLLFLLLVPVYKRPSWLPVTYLCSPPMRLLRLQASNGTCFTPASWFSLCWPFSY
jgi:hypothetical protein